jgi:hypothetical protein
MTAHMLIPAARITRAEISASPRRLGALITAGAAVLAIVLATALPARAAPDAEDLAKTLLGLAIIGAIASSIDDNDNDRGRGDRYKPAPTPPKRDKHAGRIPSSCAIQINGKKRDAVVYSENCLRKSGVTKRLPYHCGTEAKIYGRWDTLFSAKCLRDAGFRVGISPND